LRIKHIPVLLDQSIDQLITDPNGIYVDCTFGRGGHSRRILERLSDKGKLIAFDLDNEAMEESKAIKKKNFKFHKTNFSQIGNFFEDDSLMGVLIDCGVSSPQLDEPVRGFSFQKDGPLDMRFNKDQELTCSDIIENYSEKELSQILWKLGEEEESRRIAKFIVKRREIKRFESTTDLANLIELAKRKRTKKHSATKSFQALRMAVNSELENLSKCLEALKTKLKRSGKLVVISFHSLEDRIAKQTFKTQPNLVEKKIPIFNDIIQEKFTVSKVLLATDDEISLNPRSRSAKMRLIEKL
jgi:16S rRNA (cytosine1402-N4)-methyltransferase|tara:strand:- start:835 stop:1731 length:897 start_codon:yes stop_codon:yes gene_type:complete